MSQGRKRRKTREAGVITSKSSLQIRKKQLEQHERERERKRVGDRHLVTVRERGSHFEREGAEDDKAAFSLLSIQRQQGQKEAVVQTK